MQAQEPIFYDESGRRWRRLRRGALVAGVVTTLLFVIAAITVLIPPLLPDLPLLQTANDSLGRVARSGRVAPRRVISARAERERLLSRQRLFAELEKHPAPPARHYSQMSIVRPRIRYDSALAARSPADPIVAGFYVNWDDNSLVSLRQRIDSLDWVVAEWVLLGRGADTVPFTYQVDRRVLALAAGAANHPQVFAMITNYTGEDFEAKAVAHLVDNPRIRKKAIADLVAMLDQYNLAGVTIDFEQIPARMHPKILAFLGELRAALAPSGRLLTQCLPVDDATWPIAEYARLNDRVFVMLYDENDASDEPGPIASDGWFQHSLSLALRSLPREKVIATVGQYGYHWVDSSETAELLDFQEMIQAARDRNIHPALDTVSGNPTFAWSDSGTRHIVWYLDAVTAYNQIRTALANGVAGVGIWRLGSEDPSIWSVLGRGGLASNPAPLDTIRNSYDVEFVGSGEILRMVAEPTPGRRTLSIDPHTGRIIREQITDYPSTYVIRRYGRRDKQIALTFDDGPDPVFTPMILDTLRSRGVHATFFIIGENAEVHPDLLRRTFREGHEIGNHTFTHPNLALVGKSVTRVELNATERLIEAVLNRRTALLRPPYFGDAEPTTADELVPISVAQTLGYITVGLHIDPDDWARPGVDSIIARTLKQLDRGNVVLLHDSGGDRYQTVAALGPLIDSIKARGYSLVTVSELAHIPRDVAMAPLAPGSRIGRFVELTSFSLVGTGELVLRAVFLLAMVLGGARLLFILSLAIIQRIRSHRAPVTNFHPTVSVIVPAYREELVILRTIESLLAQGYDGLEIIVVDDGSSDRTYEVSQRAFGNQSGVRIFRKENGGKSSALNFGLAYVTGEVVVALDADTLFPPGTIKALVAPLEDPRVGAVAGNAKVGNRLNLVTRWQAIEYVTSQNLDRRAFALLNCITVVPGAIGAWRRQLVTEAGGFSDQTLAEDQDLTMTLLRQGWRIAYADKAVALTEAPDNLKSLAKQRFRWSFGTLQCAWKHRGVLLRPKYGTMGLVAMPNIWIFQLLLPAISPAADLLFLWSLVSVWINKVQHGSEYAMQTLQQVLFFYSVFLLVDLTTALVALWMEEGEERWLSWLVLLQRFAYRQVMYWVVLRSLVAALRGRVIGWGKLERKATVAFGSTNSD